MMPADLLPVSHYEMICELERELVLRRRVYPKSVERKIMSQKTADRRIEIMEAILAMVRVADGQD